jgi:CspA family cold shock protein
VPCGCLDPGLPREAGTCGAAGIVVCVQQVRRDLDANQQKGNTAVSEREVGTVKWFNNSKGYGFITREGAEDVFVHHTAIRGEGYKSLEDGDRVEFLVQQGPKGLQAADVVRL